MSSIYTLIKDADIFKVQKVFLINDYYEIVKRNGLIFEHDTIAIYTAKALMCEAFDYSITQIDMTEIELLKSSSYQHTEKEFNLVTTDNVPTWKTIAKLNKLNLFKIGETATLKSLSDICNIAESFNHQAGNITSVRDTSKDTVEMRLNYSWNKSTIHFSVRPEQYIITFNNTNLDLEWLPLTTFNLCKQ